MSVINLKDPVESLIEDLEKCESINEVKAKLAIAKIERKKFFENPCNKAYFSVELPIGYIAGT